MSAQATTRRFRAAPSRGIEKGKQGVDREAGIIYGYSVATTGEASGHELELDGTTLDQIVELGNRQKLGVKSRFGHPKMSAESLGTFVGRSKNFRRDGEQVRADLHLSATAASTPNGDLRSYVLELAAEDPDAFGTSIAAAISEEYRIEPDGTPAKDADGEYLMPLARVERLYAVDVVDEPAANEGLFEGRSFFSADVGLSADLLTLLDAMGVEPADAVSTLLGFLDRYADSDERRQRVGEFLATLRSELDGDDAGDDPETHSPEEGDPMEWSDVTLASLRENRPEILDEHTRELGATVGAEERTRCTRIVKDASQFEGKLGKPVCDVIAPAIEKGLSAEASLAAVQSVRIVALEAGSKETPDVGPNGDVPKKPAEKDLSHLTVEERAKAQWESDPELREEFSSLSVYTAFLKADERGSVKILNRKKGD